MKYLVKMKIELVILLLFAFSFELFGNGVVHSSVPEADATQKITIVEAKFETSEEGTDGIYKTIESNQLPLREGICYGWKIQLMTLKEEVTWKEELILPSKPKTWGESKKHTLGKDKKTAITKETVTTKNGWISNGWCVVEGDPPGEYMMKIYLDDELVKIFKFWLK